MRRIKWLFAIILIVGISNVSHAFDICRDCDDPKLLEKQLNDNIDLRIPIKYHKVFRNIRFITDPQNKSFMPFAVETQGSQVIVFPAKFAKFMCQSSVATYLLIEGFKEKEFEQAAQAAAKCFETTNSQEYCLNEFGNQLSRIYQREFTSLPENHKRVAYSLYEAALHQVIIHEYAHHFLNHFTRINAQSLSRIDAEFEADLFAVLNGLQAGDAGSAMYYFFNGLAAIENYTSASVTGQYESAKCRLNNVDNIVAYTGAAPLLLLDTAFGGGYRLRNTSAQLVHSIAEEMFSANRPVFNPGGCKKLRAPTLETAYEELKQLYLRIDRESEVLLDKQKGMNASQSNLLMRDLIEMSNKFKYMNGLSAKTASLVVRKRGLEGHKLTPVVGSIGGILDAENVKENLLSGDVGRLLQAKGLAILQEQGTLPAKVRVEKAFSILNEAVYYNPHQSESWMNLSMLSFMRGDCVSAEKYASFALATLTGEGEKQKESTQFFMHKMRELSQNQEICRTQGANFHPYPGL